MPCPKHPSRADTGAPRVNQPLVDLLEDAPLIAYAIERAGTGIPRNGRTLSDWLAQVLQALILEKANAER